MFDLYSIESENDDIDVTDEVTVNNETAVDEAGEDSQTVDVSDISEQTAAHNEAASAGGAVVGDNAKDLEMDPVAAEEAYIMKHFGLSREDLEEAVDETIQEAETIPNADVEETDDEELEATSAGTTTVNITSPTDTHIDVNAAGDEVEVDTDAETVTDEEPVAETASDVATFEGLRNIWSREDEEGEPANAASSDVEFDVRTPQNDVNIELEGKAVTIEPNEGDEAPVESEPEAPAEDTDSEVQAPETAEEEPEAPAPETTEESLYWI